MRDEVEANAQCVRDHLRRPDHPDRQLTNAKVGSTVNRTAPRHAVSTFDEQKWAVSVSAINRDGGRRGRLYAAGCADEAAGTFSVGPAVVGARRHWTDVRGYNSPAAALPWAGVVTAIIVRGLPLGRFQRPAVPGAWPSGVAVTLMLRTLCVLPNPPVPAPKP